MKYSDFKLSSFWEFFNIEEVSREANKWGGTKVTLRTGGFREHIQLSITLDKLEKVIGGKLVLSNEFVGDSVHLNPFAKDLAKSFVGQYRFIGTTISKLVQGLWELQGSKDNYVQIEGCDIPQPTSKNVQNVLDVYVGLKAKAQFVQEAGFVRISRDEKQVVLEIFYELLV